ncbi:MAG: type II toxin-antitoxin system VapC family toxin [Candidatus Limnocylindrales bacterium]
MIAVDTSVVIAAFATWHESHAASLAVVAKQPSLPAPSALETYSVLTRLPPPHRVSGGQVAEYLAETFGERQIALSADCLRGLVPELVELGITGGASYDAVIAITTREHDGELLTLDARARRTYELVGVKARLISDPD